MQKGEYNHITNGNESLFYNTKTVYLSISGYSEVGNAIIENLRSSHGLKELSDAEIADYISSVKFVFEPEKDYSNLFWKQVGGTQMPQLLFSQIGPTAMPLPVPAVPIILTPLENGTSALNAKAGSISVSTKAISQEIAATHAPSVLQMAHKEEQSQSTGSTKKGVRKPLDIRKERLMEVYQVKRGISLTLTKEREQKIEAVNEIK
jgi:hypothetical protein